MKHRRLPRHLHLSFCLLLLISISHHIVPVRCGCGDAFDVAAAQALAPPADLDCSTARLLVHSINYEDFEGMGSILHAVAESAAEAYWEGRVLLWGPPSVAPLLLRNVTDRRPRARRTMDTQQPQPPLGSPLEAYFEPFAGGCRWDDHVHREEAHELPMAGSSARVMLSHPRRGGPALFAPPRHLSDLLTQKGGGVLGPPPLGRAAVAE